MEFVKEFATFLHKNGIIKFGDFTLSSGTKSSYYIDLRLVPSYPHQFRKMIKNLQNSIVDSIGLENFDSFASVPTGGLVIASALALETVKPLVYVRTKPKDYGTSKSIEGMIQDGMKIVMIDDVATTGKSVVNGIKSLKDSGVMVKDAFVIINRLEGADKNLEEIGVKLHHIIDILEISKILHEEKLIDDAVFSKVKEQVSIK